MEKREIINKIIDLMKEKKAIDTYSKHLNGMIEVLKKSLDDDCIGKIETSEFRFEIRKEKKIKPIDKNSLLGKIEKTHPEMITKYIHHDRLLFLLEVGEINEEDVVTNEDIEVEFKYRNAQIEAEETETILKNKNIITGG